MKTALVTFLVLGTLTASASPLKNACARLAAAPVEDGGAYYEAFNRFIIQPLEGVGFHALAVKFTREVAIEGQSLDEADCSMLKVLDACLDLTVQSFEDGRSYYRELESKLLRPLRTLGLQSYAADLERRLVIDGRETLSKSTCSRLAELY